MALLLSAGSLGVSNTKLSWSDSNPWVSEVSRSFTTNEVVLVKDDLGIRCAHIRSSIARLVQRRPQKTVEESGNICPIEGALSFVEEYCIEGNLKWLIHWFAVVCHFQPPLSSRSVAYFEYSSNSLLFPGDTNRYAPLFRATLHCWKLGRYCIRPPFVRPFLQGQKSALPFQHRQTSTYQFISDE